MSNFMLMRAPPSVYGAHDVPLARPHDDAAASADAPHSFCQVLAEAAQQGAAQGQATLGSDAKADDEASGNELLSQAALLAAAQTVAFNMAQPVTATTQAPQMTQTPVSQEDEAGAALAADAAYEQARLAEGPAAYSLGAARSTQAGIHAAVSLQKAATPSSTLAASAPQSPQTIVSPQAIASPQAFASPQASASLQAIASAQAIASPQASASPQAAALPEASASLQPPGTLQANTQPPSDTSTHQLAPGPLRAAADTHAIHLSEYATRVRPQQGAQMAQPQGSVAAGAAAIGASAQAEQADDLARSPHAETGAPRHETVYPLGDNKPATPAPAPVARPHVVLPPPHTAVTAARPAAPIAGISAVAAMDDLPAGVEARLAAPVNVSNAQADRSAAGAAWPSASSPATSTAPSYLPEDSSLMLLQEAASAAPLLADAVPARDDAASGAQQPRPSEAPPDPPGGAFTQDDASSAPTSHLRAMGASHAAQGYRAAAAHGAVQTYQHAAAQQVAYPAPGAADALNVDVCAAGLGQGRPAAPKQTTSKVDATLPSTWQGASAQIEGGARAVASKDGGIPPRPIGLDQLGETLTRQAHHAPQRLQLHVTPPELGRLDIDISLKDGALHIRMATESVAAAQHVQQHLQDMATQIKDAGLSLGGFDVTTQDGNAAPGRAAQDQTQAQDDRRRGSSNFGPAADDISVATAPTLSSTTASQHRGVLDVIA